MPVHESRLASELAAAIDDADVEVSRYVSAERLAGEESFERAVVGLTGDSDPVIVAWRSSHTAISGYPIGAEYPGRERRRITKAEDADELETWIHERGEEYWRWLHPRFRWVFDER